MPAKLETDPQTLDVDAEQRKQQFVAEIVVPELQGIVSFINKYVSNSTDKDKQALAQHLRSCLLNMTGMPPEEHSDTQGEFVIIEDEMGVSLAYKKGNSEEDYAATKAMTIGVKNVEKNSYATVTPSHYSPSREKINSDDMYLCGGNPECGELSREEFIKIIYMHGATQAPYSTYAAIRMMRPPEEIIIPQEQTPPPEVLH